MVLVVFTQEDRASGIGPTIFLRVSSDEKEAETAATKAAI